MESSPLLPATPPPTTPKRGGSKVYKCQACKETGLSGDMKRCCGCHAYTHNVCVAEEDRHLAPAKYYCIRCQNRSSTPARSPIRSPVRSPDDSPIDLEAFPNIEHIDLEGDELEGEVEEV